MAIQERHNLAAALRTLDPITMIKEGIAARRQRRFEQELRTSWALTRLKLLTFGVDQSLLPKDLSLKAPVDLTGLVLSGCNLSETDFRMVSLPQSNLDGCILDDTNFCGVNMQGASMQKCKGKDVFLYATQLPEADLSGTDFRYPVMVRANLRRARLAGTILDFGSLNGADLSEAAIIGADFSHMDVYGTNFTGASLSNSRFYYAPLFAARTDGANSLGATIKNCTPEDLKSWNEFARYFTMFGPTF